MSHGTHKSYHIYMSHGTHKVAHTEVQALVYTSWHTYEHVIQDMHALCHV